MLDNNIKHKKYEVKLRSFASKMFTVQKLTAGNR